MSHYPDNSNNVICPSAAWDTYCEAQERANTPSHHELLDELDAYRHLNYTVGFSDEFNEDVAEDSDRGDWLACADFNVCNHLHEGLIVAFHLVVNSDSGGFIDTLESGVVPADKAPYGLLEYWLDIGLEQDCNWTKRELDDANAAVTRWREDLKAEIDKARRIADGEQCEQDSRFCPDDVATPSR